MNEPRNPRRRSNNKNRNRPQQAAGNSHPNSAGSSGSGPRKRPQTQRNNNSNRRPKSLSPIRILQKYENLMDQHIVARRKYYEMHGRLVGKQLEKVEQNFQRTLLDLRNFEQGLKDWQKEVLESKVNLYPEDRHYSTVHEISPEGERVPFAGEFEDPHLLPSQTNHEYSDDKEETIGSIEDYYKYKGIDPVEKS